MFLYPLSHVSTACSQGDKDDKKPALPSPMWKNECNSSVIMDHGSLCIHYYTLFITKLRKIKQNILNLIAAVLPVDCFWYMLASRIGRVPARAHICVHCRMYIVHAVRQSMWDARNPIERLICIHTRFDFSFCFVSFFGVIVPHNVNDI